MGSQYRRTQLQTGKDRKHQVKKFDSKNVYPSDGRQRFSDGDLANLSNNLDILLTQPSDAGSRMTRSKGSFGLFKARSEIPFQLVTVGGQNQQCRRRVDRGNNFSFFISLPFIPACV